MCYWAFCDCNKLWGNQRDINELQSWAGRKGLGAVGVAHPKCWPFAYRICHSGDRAWGEVGLQEAQQVHATVWAGGSDSSDRMPDGVAISFSVCIQWSSLQPVAGEQGCLHMALHYMLVTAGRGLWTTLWFHLEFPWKIVGMGNSPSRWDLSRRNGEMVITFLYQKQPEKLAYSSGFQQGDPPSSHPTPGAFSNTWYFWRLCMVSYWNSVRRGQCTS